MSLIFAVSSKMSYVCVSTASTVCVTKNLGHTVLYLNGYCPRVSLSSSRSTTMKDSTMTKKKLTTQEYARSEARKLETPKKTYHRDNPRHSEAGYRIPPSNSITTKIQLKSGPSSAQLEIYTRLFWAALSINY